MYKKRRYGSYMPAALAARAIQRGYRGYRSRLGSSNALGLGRATAFSRGGIMTMMKNKVSSGRGVTVQHDARNIYRKRFMPRYKKKPWKRFVSKVHAVAEKDLGSRTVVFSDNVTLGNGTTGNQSCLTIGLYTLQSTNSWLSDLNNISALENNANPTAALGSTVDSSSKYIFQSGVLDITIRNTSFLSTTTNLDPNCTLEIDLYEIVSRKDFMQTSNSATSLSVALAEGSNNTKTIGGAGTGITISSRGATPFDIPLGISRFGLSVLKKTKYFVSNGQTITYQVRDPGRHVMSERDMSNENGVGMPKLTRFVYVIAKAVPGVSVGSALGQTTEQMTVGATRKYMYKIEGISEDRSRYISNISSGINPN